MPFFALVAAGVAVRRGALLRDPIAIGVALGLVVGKPLGVLGGTYLVTRFTHAELNEDLTGRSWSGSRCWPGSASRCRCWSPS